MNKLTRRDFGKQGLLLTCFTVMGFPAVASAFLDKAPNNAFLNRDDLGHALKSLYFTYDGTSKYLHKFNDVVSKTQLHSLQFHIDMGTDKEYVEHYLTIMQPLLHTIQAKVQQTSAEQGLVALFEDNSSSYQLFEHITVEPGRRSFPCPYKPMLGYCKQYLGTFSMAWEDVCTKWCTPVWTGFAAQAGIKVAVMPGETCGVKLTA